MDCKNSNRLTNMKVALTETKCMIPSNFDDVNVRAAWQANWNTRYQALDLLRHIPLGHAMPDFTPKIVISKQSVNIDEYVIYYISQANNIWGFGKSVNFNQETNELEIQKYIPAWKAENDTNYKAKRTKALNEWSITPVDDTIFVHESKIIASAKHFEQLIIHWGKQLQFETGFQSNNQQSVIDIAKMNLDIQEYLNETGILDVILPTHYLRIIDDKNIPRFPFQCSSAQDTIDACEFKSFTKFESYKTVGLDANRIYEIMTEKYYCKTHKKV